MTPIGILCAGDEELAPFLPHIQNAAVTHKAMLTFYEGQINGQAVVALYSGVCKVNAAIAAQILIDTYRVGILINAGTAGGMDEKIQLLDTVIATQAAYHDVDDGILTEFHPWLPSVYFESDPGLVHCAEILCAAHPHIYLGRMVTGEQFITDALRHDINKKYAPLTVDMETASVAHVCHVNGIPFIAIRSVTDTAAHAGLQNFEQNCRQAASIAKGVTLEFLTLLAGRLP